MEFDSLYIKFGGIDEEGYHDAKAIVGFSDDSGLNRSDIEIDIRFQADLDASLRELREQAKALALENLRKATQLCEQFSADQMHSKAQDASTKNTARDEKNWTQSLTDALEKSSLGNGNRS